MRKTIAILVALVALCVLATPPVEARRQGMTLATAKLLMGDLLDAGYEATIKRRNGGTTYIVTVSTGTGGPTAQQVQNFATARSVTARVLAVEFE